LIPKEPGPFVPSSGNPKGCDRTANGTKVQYRLTASFSQTHKHTKKLGRFPQRPFFRFKQETRGVIRRRGSRLFLTERSRGLPGTLCPSPLCALQFARHAVVSPMCRFQVFLRAGPFPRFPALRLCRPSSRPHFTSINAAPAFPWAFSLAPCPFWRPGHDIHHAPAGTIRKVSRNLNKVVARSGRGRWPLRNDTVCPWPSGRAMQEINPAWGLWPGQSRADNANGFFPNRKRAPRGSGTPIVT